MNRSDMLVELASDQVNQVQQLLEENSYESVHSWLHPIFLNTVKVALADLSDDDLETYYCDQMGVDRPSSPPLSSMDAQEKNQSEVSYESSEIQFGSMSRSSHLDKLAVSLIHSICNAPRLGEVAAERPSPPAGEATVHWY